MISRFAFRQHPVAVITIEANRPIDKLRAGSGQVDFEWFNTVQAAYEWMGQWEAFASQDGLGRFDRFARDGLIRAHLVILVTDTQTVKTGRVEVFPQTRATQRWRDETLADLSLLFEP